MPRIKPVAAPAKKVKRVSAKWESLSSPIFFFLSFFISCQPKRTKGKITGQYLEAGLTTLVVKKRESSDRPETVFFG